MSYSDGVDQFQRTINDGKMSLPDRTFTLRLPDDVRSALEQRAEKEGMKPGTFARRVLKRHLQPVLKRATQGAVQRRAG